MYKVHFENRFITISSEPDRIQKYGLFYKFNDTNEFYRTINNFQNDISINSMNVFGPDITFIWKLFRINFTEVGAAGGLVRHTSGKYLFIMKNDKLDLPKGHIDEGESPEECALREVGEECGISGHSILKSLPPSYHTYNLNSIAYLKRTCWFLMKYSGEMVNKPQVKEGIKEVLWLLPDEISRKKNIAWLSLGDVINSVLRSPTYSI
jgi:8-oxo-dGTP pyrophosphatase MutT (NUDIX family)